MTFALLFGVFGLIVGSFLNVFIIRHGARSLTGRSACMACGRQLFWYDMVPVLSWLFLRGRCRACSSRISLQYPLVEATIGALFAFLGASMLPMPEKVLGCIMAALLVAIAAYDLRHTIIPDPWAYTFASLALFSALVFPLQA